MKTHSVDRRRLDVRYASVTIDTIIDAPSDTESPDAILLLPSLGRDSLDFDDLAVRLAVRGFKVLRPQPRGVLGSSGPLDGITQHDFARDIAEVIAQIGNSRAIVGGHAYGNWVARQTATDFPDLVRGVILIAAAARNAPKHLGQVVTDAGDPNLAITQRIQALQTGFFAPGHDASIWLTGWHPAIKAIQRQAADAVPRDQWWPAGSAPILDLQAEHDPFMPPDMRLDMRNTYGPRVTQRLIAGASHALIPEQPDAVADAIVKWAADL